MIALPLLWGQAMAYAEAGVFSWAWFAVAQLFGLLCQVYSLYLNDFADEALDRSNDSYWLSGGSRVLPDGLLEGDQLYRAAGLCASLLLLLGAASFEVGRAVMLPLALAAVVLGWSYSLPPLRSSYRGYGELHQAISCGVVLPVSGYYLQAGTTSLMLWLSLAPLGLLFFASNIVTALPDVNSDKQGGKLSYPVRNGSVRAKRDALLLSAAAGVLVLPLANLQLSSMTLGGLLACPALALVGRAASRRPELAHSSSPEVRREALKRFMLLVLGSHAWLLFAWTGLLFWRGVQAG